MGRLKSLVGRDFKRRKKTASGKDKGGTRERTHPNTEEIEFL